MGALGVSEAERVDPDSDTVANYRARPWPERPVSGANKSGKHNIAPRGSVTYCGRS